MTRKNDNRRIADSKHNEHIRGKLPVHRPTSMVPEALVAQMDLRLFGEAAPPAPISLDQAIHSAVRESIHSGLPSGSEWFDENGAAWSITVIVNGDVDHIESIQVDVLRPQE